MSTLKFSSWQDLNGNTIYDAGTLGAMGTWTTWTPTFTGVTAQPATIQAQYSQVNDLVFWAVYFAFGGAGTPNGSLRFTAPVTSTGFYESDYFVNGQSWMRPDGTTIFMGMSLAINNDIWLYAPQRLASDYIQGSDNVNASTPITWTSSGSAWFSGWYQAA